jgi:hypothetical protein
MIKKKNVFVLFAFLFLTLPTIKAQTSELSLYPNEAQGYEFYNQGRLKGLCYLVSTKDDVKQIFGNDCARGCDYNEDWKMEIRYVGEHWQRYSTVRGEQTKFFKPLPEYIGKLYSITMYPKRVISFTNVAFPKEFYCYNYWIGISDSFKRTRIKLDGCTDLENNLTYSFYGEPTEDGKYKKGDVRLIIYDVPSETENKIWVEVKK